MRALVAEDDSALRSVLERGLRENGYVVDAVVDGESALRHLRSYDYDVAVLDWRLPKRSGIDIIVEARRIGDRTPILMLTARDTAADRVAGSNLRSAHSRTGSTVSGGRRCSARSRATSSENSNGFTR